MSRWKWEIKRFGIEALVVSDGVRFANTLKEAQDGIDIDANTFGWGEWQEGEIQLDERNKLCLDPPVPCWTKEKVLGKPCVITMWEAMDG